VLQRGVRRQVGDWVGVRRQVRVGEVVAEPDVQLSNVVLRLAGGVAGSRRSGAGRADDQAGRVGEPGRVVPAAAGGAGGGEGVVGGEVYDGLAGAAVGGDQACREPGADAAAGVGARVGGAP
jgi:hypothetical protein